MKKILLVFAFFCFFTINASAQEKRLTSQEAAKKDAIELAELVGLKDNQIEDFYRLFEVKYTTLENRSLSAEKKAELEQVMDAKIRATLNEKQMSILEANKALFEKLKK
ncbi:hypothetical protein [Flavobacterium sp.]|uniref:hypothetical protein n=1 Tax=Flavobacterium sp. TaxID=239 RepID=UPI0026025DE3|nr:hypothetical protein [Flavobacterium sp.]